MLNILKSIKKILSSKFFICLILCITLTALSVYTLEHYQGNLSNSVLINFLLYLLLSFFFFIILHTFFNKKPRFETIKKLHGYNKKRIDKASDYRHLKRNITDIKKQINKLVNIGVIKNNRIPWIYVFNSVSNKPKLLSEHCLSKGYFDLRNKIYWELYENYVCISVTFDDTNENIHNVIKLQKSKFKSVSRHSIISIDLYSLDTDNLYIYESIPNRIKQIKYIGGFSQAQTHVLLTSCENTPGFENFIFDLNYNSASIYKFYLDDISNKSVNASYENLIVNKLVDNIINTTNVPLRLKSLNFYNKIINAIKKLESGLKSEFNGNVYIDIQKKSNSINNILLDVSNNMYDTKYTNKLKLNWYDFISIIIFVLSFVLWMNSFNNQIDITRDINTRFIEINSESNSTPIAYELDSLLPILNNLENLVNISKNINPEVEYTGLYSLIPLQITTNDIYIKKLINTFSSKIDEDLTTILINSSDINILNKTLKVYLMLCYPDKLQRKFVIKYFNNIWNFQYAYSPITVSSLRRHLNVYLDNIEAFPIDRNLVTEVRKKLNIQPIHKRAYNALLSNYRIKYLYPFKIYPNLNLTLIENNKSIINFVYTKDGFNSIFKKDIFEYIESELKDNWFYGLSDKLTQSEYRQTYSKAEDLYFDDYQRHWHNFINSLQYKRSNSFKQLLKKINSILSPSRPIYKLISFIESNTGNLHKKETESKNISVSLPRKTKRFEKLYKLLKDGLNDSGIRMLSNSFKKYNNFVNDDAYLIANDNDFIHRLDQITEHINTLNTSNNVYVESSEILELIIEDRSLLDIQNINTPGILRNVILYLTHDFSKLLIVNTKSYLNEIYANQVLDFYENKLYGRFPIDKDSLNEVKLQDYKHFYNNDGVFLNFYKSYISKYMVCKIKCVGKKVFNGLEFPVSDIFEDNYKDVILANKNIFGYKNEPAFNLDYEIIELDKNISQFTFKVNDRIVSYRHGPIYKESLKWPDPENSLVASIISTDHSYVDYLEYTGDWSLIKLLDRAQIQLIKPDEFLAKLQFKDMEVKIKFYSEYKNINPKYIFSKLKLGDIY